MLTVLAGCSGLPSVGPDYRGPPPERSIALGQSPAPVKVEADRWQAPLPHAGSNDDLARWWQQFNDPALDAFIAAAQRDAELARGEARVAARACRDARPTEDRPQGLPTDGDDSPTDGARMYSRPGSIRLRSIAWLWSARPRWPCSRTRPRVRTSYAFIVTRSTHRAALPSPRRRTPSRSPTLPMNR
jgi:hypothetical protein